jgi:4-hydroxy-tetrahydrodipicolinate synthase
VHLSGSITALATPFAPDGALDLDAWQRLLHGQLTGGAGTINTSAVVVAGSTGEAQSLGDDEYDQLLRSAVEAAAGRIPVLAGTGLSNTAKTIALTRRAAALGASAALVVTPPYVRPTQAGLIAHYRAVAAEGGLPVVLYNVPGRTGCDLLPETVAVLRDVPGVIAVKEAVTEPARIAALLALRRDGFAVLSGDDPTAAQAMLSGADGVISVASNVLPASMARLAALARAGRREDAEAWDAQLQPTFALLGAEPNPIPLKAVMQRLGIGHGLRLPLTALSDAHTATADAIAAGIPALERSAVASAEA